MGIINEQDHSWSIFSFTSFLLFHHEDLEEIHFVRKESLKHCLTIVFPFKVLSVTTDDLLDDQILYIQQKESSKYFALKLKNQEEHNLWIDQLLDDNTYTRIELSTNEITFHASPDKPPFDVINIQENFAVNKDKDWYFNACNIPTLKLPEVFQFKVTTDEQFF